jgi:hypothetical protein
MFLFGDVESSIAKKLKFSFTIERLLATQFIAESLAMA